MNQKFQAFLSQLGDFSSLKQNPPRQSLPLEQRSLNRITQSEQGDFMNNSKLLNQFKTMRERIKVLNKENTEYKTNYANIYKQIQSKFIGQIMSLQDKDVQNTAALNFLKKEMQKINQGIDQLKIKNNDLQKQLNDKKNLQKELEFFQTSIVQIKQLNEDLKRENEKINQISIIEKIQFEQKLRHQNLMKQVDKQYVTKLECELNKSRQKCLTLESKYRKIVNQYQQTRYDREKINEYSLKEQDLEYLIGELKKDKATLKTQLTQQKQRRLKIEEIMMEKQEFSSLYSIQIQTLQRQLNNLKKKNKKLTVKCQQKDIKAQKQAYKNIQSKSKLYKSIQIIQQFFAKIKRQLTLPHDLLQFLKATEYKISKLSEEQQRSLSKSKNQKSPPKSSFKKSEIKSSTIEKQQITSKQQNQTSSSSSSVFTPRYLNEIIKDRTPLKQSTQQIDQSSRQQSKTNVLKRSDDEVSRKVKKQREQKQRKIREGILYKKLESSNNQKQKYLIRQQIVKLNNKEQY